VNQLGCHVSVLNPGRSPHLPHSHLDEEILVVLDGRAQIVIAESPQDPNPRIEEFGAGDFIYYPAFQHHTIRCIGDRPVTYLMFRWHAFRGEPAQDAMGVTIHRAADYAAPELKPRSIRTSLLFEGPTAHCAKLHFHRTRVNDGGGYAAHVDEHDVAIVLLRGKVRTLGRTVRAPAVVHYPAGEMHGLRGIGATPAEYLVVEFHRGTGDARDGRNGEVPATAMHRRRVELEYRLRAARAAIERTLQALRRALPRRAPAMPD
jgi:mannose-6-phosphate isomerase-like protein (cupin superfamily)